MTPVDVRRCPPGRRRYCFTAFHPQANDRLNRHIGCFSCSLTPQLSGIATARQMVSTEVHSVPSLEMRSRDDLAIEPNSFLLIRYCIPFLSKLSNKIFFCPIQTRLPLQMAACHIAGDITLAVSVSSLLSFPSKRTALQLVGLYKSPKNIGYL